MLLHAPSNSRPRQPLLRLKFPLPGTETWVSVDAVIVRQVYQQKSCAWGVQFLQRPPELRQYVHAKLSELPTATKVAPPSSQQQDSSGLRRLYHEALSDLGLSKPPR
jgi:hypothetical protein